VRTWSYRGRWALVTGASAGLGVEFARQLADRGMSLVLSARREDRLTTLATELRKRPGIEAVVLTADLGEEGEPVGLWKRASEGRTIDLLVNNAGFGAMGRYDAIPLERQTEMVRVNCIALMEMAHAALAEMRARGDGGIINVASIAAFQPVPRLATYAATKAFVLSLSESLWSENRDAGVRVVALCPGRTPTEFQGVAGTGSTRGTFGERSPEAVVAAGLSALEEGKISIVPGLENRLASFAGRVAPRSLLTGALRSIVRRRSEKA